jgi:hypothetical protein
MPPLWAPQTELGRPGEFLVSRGVIKNAFRKKNHWHGTVWPGATLAQQRDANLQQPVQEQNR